jgi:hypothetical protein
VNFDGVPNLLILVDLLNFRLNMSNGLGLRPQKEKSRFSCFWTSQWAFKNPTFSPVVPRDSRPAPADGQNQSSWAFYKGSNSPEPFSIGIFGKSFSSQILVKQGKVQLLLKKPCHFSEKKFKNQEYALDF